MGPIVAPLRAELVGAAEELGGGDHGQLSFGLPSSTKSQSTLRLSAAARATQTRHETDLDTHSAARREGVSNIVQLNTHCIALVWLKRFGEFVAVSVSKVENTVADLQ